MTEKQNETKFYDIMSFAWWQAVSCPQFPLELYQRANAGGSGGRNKTFVPSQPPRSHLTVYNLFSSQGRGKEKRQEAGKAEKETERPELMFPLHYNPRGGKSVNSEVIREIRHLSGSGTLEPRCAPGQAGRGSSGSFPRLAGGLGERLLT